MSAAPRSRPADGWRRLHPLSPIARIGRVVPVLVIALIVPLSGNNGTGDSSFVFAYVTFFAVLSVVFGLIHWLVTRWRLDGDALRIETGLVRRDSRRLPLARIQSVDIVRPFLARILALSELRVRLAGSGSADGRLAYLSEQEA
ncbi:MAG TPA: PH domain-containing protein, partial [Acidimicrobiales bacterium]|nr:PH domain-containing protein [Acidimicrobiales bacterium]